jgi:cytosine permease
MTAGTTGSAGWLRRVGPWVGIGTSPAALMMGGGVAQGIEGPLLLAAIGVGVLALAALAAAQGVIGQRGGRPLLALSADALGAIASRRTAAPVMLAMMVGWFALNTSVGGAALGRLVGLPDRAGIVLFAAAMLAVVWAGVEWLSWSALAAGVASAALAAYGAWIALGDRNVSLTGDGHPAHPVGFAQSVALVVGYGAAFALRSPDFTRDLARTRHVIWCAAVGMALPVAAFATTGAALYLSTGTWNLADVLRGLGSPTIAYLFVAVGFTGSVMTNIYSGALSLTDAVPRAGHRRALVAVAVAGTALAALDFSRWMVGYLTVIALAAPSLIAVICVHALRGGEPRSGWNVAGLAAWGAGFAAGLALHLAGSSLGMPVSLAVAAALCAIIDRPRRSRARGSIAIHDQGGA